MPIIVPPSWITAARPGPRLLVLAYHAVSATWNDPLAVSPEVFQGQIRALADRGYHGVTFTEAALRPNARPSVAITFDDAFPSVREARGILDEVGWPATVFAPTVPVETREPMRWLVGDRWSAEAESVLVPLSWDELGELHEAGWEIGSHSRTHRLISSLEDAEAQEELAGSRREIVARLGLCSSISYPWGELDQRVIALAREAGYVAGSGLVGGSPRQPLAVPRFAVGAADGSLRYGLKTSAAVWRVRESSSWLALERVRRRRRPIWPLADRATRRTALVMDGDSGPGLAVVRSLGRAGWRVLAPAGTRSARSRFVSGIVDLPELVERPNDFASALAAAVAAEGVDLLVPCSDASLEAAWRCSGPEGPRVAGGDAETVGVALDKRECLRAAERLGFGTPNWGAPASPQEAFELLEQVGIPCVVKPRRSFALRGGRLQHRRHRFAGDRDELAQALVALAEPDGALPIVQEYVPGRSLSVTAVVQRGGLVASVARETLSFYPIAGGTSVWKRTVAPDDVGVEDALRFLLGLGLEGLAEIEYQVGADGVPRMMEIGARIHGWVPLAVAAGVDLPLLAARVALGEEVAPVEGYRCGVEMRWPAGEAHRFAAALRPGAGLPPGMTRRGVLARSWPPWRPGMRYDGLELGDPRPWLRTPGGALRARR